MKTHHFITGFSLFGFLAIATVVVLFQQTTFQAKLIDIPEYSGQYGERLLGREPCTYVEAILGTDEENCERIGRLQCLRAYGLKGNPHGDTNTYPRNCLKQCLRDITAQCDEYASSAYAFKREGER